jgi:hypothetical protein
MTKQEHAGHGAVGRQGGDRLAVAETSPASPLRAPASDSDVNNLTDDRPKRTGMVWYGMVPPQPPVSVFRSLRVVASFSTKTHCDMIKNNTREDVPNLLRAIGKSCQP